MWITKFGIVKKLYYICKEFNFGVSIIEELVYDWNYEIYGNEGSLQRRYC